MSDIALYGQNGSINNFSFWGMAQQESLVMNMKTRSEYTCPLEMTHDIIKGKWKPIIIWQLHKSSLSLSSLRKSIQGISQKMLVQHLHKLCEYGLIDNTKSDGYPLKPDYFLTERGKQTFEVGLSS